MTGLPLVAALFTTPSLGASVFGEKWEEAIPLLRLESITTLIGLALTPSYRFCFWLWTHGG